MRNTDGLLRRGPGRPKGVPNKATLELKAFWHQFFASKDYREAAKQRMTEGKAPHLESFLLAKVYGKPVEVHQLEGVEGQPISVVHKHIHVTK